MKTAPLLIAFVLAAACGQRKDCPDAAVQRDMTQDAAAAAPADLACVPQFKQCLAPAMCCAGLTCVGGACAKVAP
jgi:hypothetical protein